jgi:uncharacterized protein YndB with AHSA1/START domain
MKTNLIMDFKVDKKNKKILVKRQFEAPLKKVWKAWTNSEILDQWWAPKPWKVKTKKMEFRKGGSWLCIMEGPKGEEHWGRIDYTSVNPLKSFSGIDSFSDKKGNINTNLPQAKWKIDFSELQDTTMVTIETTYDTPADLEKIMKMGFEEGFTKALENLDKLLNLR